MDYLTGRDVGDESQVRQWWSRDDRISVSFLASALSAQLNADTGHAWFCSAVLSGIGCDSHECRQARAALDMARRRGWLDA